VCEERAPLALQEPSRQFDVTTAPRHNGKIERYNRILGEEFLYARTWTSESRRVEALGVWNRRYNYYRPHGANGGQPTVVRSGARLAISARARSTSGTLMSSSSVREINSSTSSGPPDAATTRLVTGSSTLPNHSGSPG
jgi:hypothetical protein